MNTVQAAHVFATDARLVILAVPELATTPGGRAVSHDPDGATRRACDQLYGVGRYTWLAPELHRALHQEALRIAVERAPRHLGPRIEDGARYLYSVIGTPRTVRARSYVRLIRCREPQCPTTRRAS